MSGSRTRSLRLVTTIRAFAMLILALLIFVYLEDSEDTTRVIAKAIAGTLLVGAALSLIYEYAARKAVFEDLFTSMSGAVAAQKSGILDVKMDYMDFAWEELFRTSTEVDLLFAYARSWRRTRRRDLSLFANDPNSNKRLRVILMDPDDEATVTSHAGFWGLDPNELRTRVMEAISELRDLFSNSPERLEIYVTTLQFHVAWYRFATSAIATVSPNAPDQTSSQGVPAFLLSQDGTLHEYLTAQFEAVRSSQKHTRKLDFQRN